MAIVKKQKTTTVGKKLEELELLSIAGGNVKCGATVEYARVILQKKKKIEPLYNSAILIIGT